MRRIFSALFLIVVATAAAQTNNRAGKAQIIFVCEHGAAMSVIAAQYFNKMASERGLTERATYRGVTPQAELSVATAKGLREDGFSIPAAKPGPLTTEDLDAATHVFAVGCTLPAAAVGSKKAQECNDVPKVSEGYALSRDAIKRHLEQLINQLEKR